MYGCTTNTTSKEKEHTRFISDTRTVTVDGISGWPYSS